PACREGALAYFAVPPAALGGPDAAAAWCDLGRAVARVSRRLAATLFERTAPVLGRPDGIERLRAWVDAGRGLHDTRGWLGAVLGRRARRGATRRAARGPRPGGGARGRAPRSRRRRPPRPAATLRGGGTGRGAPLVRGRHGGGGGERGRGPRLLRARVAHEPRRAARGLDRGRARGHAGRVAKARPDALGRVGGGARRGGRDRSTTARGPPRRARGRAPAPHRLAADARGQLPRLPPPRRRARRAARVRHLRAPGPARPGLRAGAARGPLPARRGRARAPPARPELPRARRRGARARHATPRGLGLRARALAHAGARRAPP